MPPSEEVRALNFEAILERQRVLVTGHTGFTGGWLARWLKALNCDVSGLALPPDMERNLFSSARIGDQLHSEFRDIRNFAVMKKVMERAKPTVAFHLAAQPLVSRSFEEPIETIATNVLGTAHVFEAARLTPGVRSLSV